MRRIRQKLGVGLIVGAYCSCVFFNLAYIPLALFAVVGALDLYLLLRGRQTVSGWVWRLFDATEDAMLMIGMVLLAPIAAYLRTHELEYAARELTKAIFYTVLGHFAWQSKGGADDAVE